MLHFCGGALILFVWLRPADIPLPGRKAREDLLRLAMKGVPLAGDVNLGELAAMAEVQLAASPVLSVFRTLASCVSLTIACAVCCTEAGL